MRNRGVIKRRTTPNSNGRQIFQGLQDRGLLSCHLWRLTTCPQIEALSLSLSPSRPFTANISPRSPSLLLCLDISRWEGGRRGGKPRAGPCRLVSRLSFSAAWDPCCCTALPSQGEGGLTQPLPRALEKATRLKDARASMAGCSDQNQFFKFDH